MKIAVVGAGGIGGYFGGLLARTGHEVVFIARGEHLQALQRHGLRVESVHGNFSLQVRATSEPREVGPAELILLCVKSYDTEDAARDAAPLMGPGTTVVPLQNGVDNFEKIASVLGRDRILIGVPYLESYIAKPGVIRQLSQIRRVDIGEMDGSSSARLALVHEVFLQAGIDARPQADILQAMWRKFVLICGVSGMTTLCRATMGRVLAWDETREMFMDCLKEAAAMGEAKGVPLVGSVEEALQMAVALGPSFKSSMLRDLEQGRRLEVEALNGTVAGLGRELGVPTPVNRCIYAALALAGETTELSFQTRERA